MAEPIALPMPEETIGPLASVYAPSWVNRFNRWVARLPVPAWAFFTLLTSFSVLVFSWTQWQAGQYPAGTFYPLHVAIAAGPYFLALVYYLDRYAQTAFARFRPALDVTPDQELTLRDQLTTLPARPTLYATLAGAGLGMLGMVVAYEQRQQLYHFADTPLSAVLYQLFYVLTWMCASAFFYHTFHQLRQIHRLYTRHTRISLFHRRPLYALAWLSAFTAMALALEVISAVSILPSASGPTALLQALVVVPFLPLPLITFVWPLWGIHRLLVAEKDRRVDQNEAGLEGTLNELHPVLRGTEGTDTETNSDTDTERLHHRMVTLEAEARLLKDIPTWPWPPEALRSVLATVLLPFVIWLVQLFLQQLLA